jgi:hypothetical protein
MFESLADQIKHDEHEQYTRRERLLEWGAIAIISVLFFGALYLGVQFLH